MAQNSVELFFETGNEIEARVRDISEIAVREASDIEVRDASEIEVRADFEIEVRDIFGLILFEALSLSSAFVQLPFGLHRFRLGPSRLGVPFEISLSEGRERIVAVKRHLGKMFRRLKLKTNLKTPTKCGHIY